MTTFYVILTLVLNAPLLGPLMTIMGLNKVTKEQLHLRKRVETMLQVKYLARIEHMLIHDNF